jgi:uncharacterized protein (TIGR03437 family)
MRVASLMIFVMAAHGGQVTFSPPLPFNGSYMTVAVDHAENIYLAGVATGDMHPTPGAFQQKRNAKACPISEFGPGCTDSFIAKLDPTGTRVLYLTFLGGNGNDVVTRIAVDADGNAYVTGSTTSSNFPAVPNLVSAHLPPGGHAFVTKLNAAGTALVYSALIGGSGNDAASGIALDPAGNAYITGTTSSADFPVSTSAFQTTVQLGNGGTAGFVTKLNGTATALVYAGFINATPAAIAVDQAGNAVVTGYSYAGNGFVTTPNAYQSKGIGGVFVTKIASSGKDLVYSTYLSSSDANQEDQNVGSDIAVDATGDAYVTGTVYSLTGTPHFPVTQGAYQTEFGGPFQPWSVSDAFVAKLSASGSLIYSTFLGGGSFDQGLGIAVDPAGNAVVTGSTDSNNFPATHDAYLPCKRNPQFSTGTLSNIFVTKLDSAGKKVPYSTYLDGFTALGAIALDVSGNAYAVSSPGQNFAITKIDFSSEPSPLTLACVANSANYVSGVVAPGEIVSLFGTGIGPEVLAKPDITAHNIGTIAGETRVLFDEIEAPILAAVSDQINVVVPYEVAGRANVQVRVEHKGSSTNALSARVVDAEHGIFTLSGRGSGQAAVLNEDGTVNSDANPAARGSIVSIFSTGVGQTNPPSITGQITEGILPKPVVPLEVYIGSATGSEVLYAGAAPGAVSGLMQINARVPADAVTGPSAPLVVVINKDYTDALYTQRVTTIAVR